MIKPWYGPVKDLHQEVICKYGSHHNIWVGSTRLIEWPEGFDCLATCLSVDCGVCEGTGATGHHIAIDGSADENNCTKCNGSGKMTREQYSQWVLNQSNLNQDAIGDT